MSNDGMPHITLGIIQMAKNWIGKEKMNDRNNRNYINRGAIMRQQAQNQQLVIDQGKLRIQ
jgi:hypothetical protein